MRTETKTREELPEMYPNKHAPDVDELRDAEDYLRPQQYPHRPVQTFTFREPVNMNQLRRNTLPDFCLQLLCAASGHK